MLFGNAEMIIEKTELVHAVDCYFYGHVRDSGLNPYATVVDVIEMDDGKFMVYLEGKTIDEEQS